MPQINTKKEVWNKKAQSLWKEGRTNEAIQEVLKELNSYKKKPKVLFEQFGYYLFMIKDYRSVCTIFEQALSLYPNDASLMQNLAVAYNRVKDFKKAIFWAKRALKSLPNDYSIYDILAHAYYKIGELELASKSGTKALFLKDEQHGNRRSKLNLSKMKASQYTKDKKRVISFSLWGDSRVYLNGALRNLLLAKDIYEGWELWFYLDDSVPKNFVKLIKDLGGVVKLQPNNQSIKEKLCWRFKVANDKSVGYFIVRDTDSVISVREFNAVQEWIESNRLFHIIRDWWTHTDLILAGLWGGVAGVLPNIELLLKEYESNYAQTDNIDQWFLRDMLWSRDKK